MLAKKVIDGALVFLQSSSRTFGRRIEENMSEVFTENPLRLARWYLAQYNIDLQYDLDDEAYCDESVGGGNNTVVSSVFSVDTASYPSVDWIGNASFYAD